jgi:hypothetical protein
MSCKWDNFSLKPTSAAEVEGMKYYAPNVARIFESSSFAIHHGFG